MIWIKTKDLKLGTVIKESENSADYEVIEIRNYPAYGNCIIYVKSVKTGKKGSWATVPEGRWRLVFNPI
jgi:hypothetical protein